MVKCSFTMCEPSRCHPLPPERKGERKTERKRKEEQKVHEEERDDKIGC